MATIEWCCKQNRGIKLIEPNENSYKEYIQTAEETLEVLRTIKGKSKVWLATTKYYCEYFAVYALLMRLGIKCEIHDYTIELCRFLEENKIIPNGFTNILENDKELRIDNQYYQKMLEFILKLKDTSLKLTVEQIQKIREKINIE